MFAQFAAGRLQRGAQPFFYRGVVERHSQQLVHGHALLNRPGQQVQQMLGIRCYRFGAQQAAVLCADIHLQAAGITPGGERAG